MNKFLALALCTCCGAAAAQTAAPNLMPDGSHDMYVGLGAVAQPRFEGAAGHRTRALPLLQVEFSNGLFVSGLSAGWHLSQRPGLEFGPLLAVQPRRDESGSGRAVGGIPVDQSSAGPSTIVGGIGTNNASTNARNRLAGMPVIKAHLLGGAFFNVGIGAGLRLTNSVLYGAGGDGLAWELAVQRVAADFASHQRLSLALGATVVNSAWNQTFFGVSESDHLRSGNPRYVPGGGVKDVFASARWNWVLSPSWMLSSSVRVARLAGDARRSPLAERATQTTVSTGLAYRF